MKFYFSLFFCFLFGFSYAQDYFDLMAKETCECVQAKKMDFSKIPYQELQASLGACMIPSFIKYKDKLDKSDQVEFSDQEGMRKLGEKIGAKMLTHCPDLMIKIGTEYLKNENADSKEEPDVYRDQDDKPVISDDLSLEGTFLETKTGDFLSVVLKEKSGRIHQLLLLNFFDNAELITNGKLKPNQKITVTYNEHEFYDPKLKDYKYYKVLYSLKVL
ncbi:hypothetical protein [Flavobacterium sp. H122]|uniref:hypothetical protein n=1 Tax=Flavobacterium sp. H122 TaxID=2529860 RepID=UPI0010AAF103|nr:hypothetical protein [Flavobacterium sp. H122]